MAFLNNKNEVKKTPIDLRITRTKKRISNAVIYLLKEKSYNSISIKDISIKATINRATVYNHYLNKQDLFENVFIDIYTDMEESIYNANYDKHNLDSEHYSPSIFFLLSYIQQHALPFQIIFKNKDIPFIYQEFYNHIYQHFYRKLIDYNSDIKELTIDYEILTHYITSAILGVIENWLKNDMKYSAFHMTRMLTDIVKRVPIRVNFQ